MMTTRKNLNSLSIFTSLIVAFGLALVGCGKTQSIGSDSTSVSDPQVHDEIPTELQKLMAEKNLSECDLGIGECTDSKTTVATAAAVESSPGLGCLCGDVNSDGNFDPVDLASFIDFLFFGAPPFPNPECANFNDDDSVDSVDMAILVDYLYPQNGQSVELGCYNPEPKDYFVAPNGNDNYDGLSESRPFKTFARAIGLAKPGDVINALPGEYDSSNTVSVPLPYIISGPVFLPITHANARSGFKNDPITIRGPDIGWAGLMGDTIGDHDFIGAFFNGVSHWVIEDLSFVGSRVWIWGGNKDSYGNTHDIVLKNNEIGSIVADGAGNPGLIKIDRADSGGAYNISILENRLSSISDLTGQWSLESGGISTRHIGAITVMSLCDYKWDPIFSDDPDVTFDRVQEDCTGKIDIVGNAIGNVPQAFYLKNAMHGPVNIRDNLIYNTNAVSLSMQASNVNFSNNLVLDVPGFLNVGNTDHIGSILEMFTAENLHVSNNTFVGVDTLVDYVSGKNHLYENNIYFDIATSAYDRTYEAAAYIRKSQYLPDPVDLAQSSLHEIESRNNCFFSEYEDMLFVKQSTVGGWNFFDQHDAAYFFGFDAGSKFYVGTDRSFYFVDPENADYTFKYPFVCPGMGRQD